MRTGCMNTVNVDELLMETFREWPLIVEGESKEIRQYPGDDEMVVTWLKPTIYSFTENRCGWVDGSNLLRARVMKTLIPLLKCNGIDHVYTDISDKTGFIVARKVHKHQDVCVICHSSLLVNAVP